MERINILKTYKLYIGGQFPRTESGRFYALKNKSNKVIANVCLSSRKDFRNAVVAARGAFPNWNAKTAFNRGQILYRIAEMLEGRKQQFIDELLIQGQDKKSAVTEINSSIDRLVYYAGWCDKYAAIFSSVNPVSSSHFNFSIPEPMGVVTIIASEKESLLGLISALAPAICGGNTIVVLASEKKPLCAISFAEVLHTSDLPSGVVNILTGTSAELHEHFASHLDVNATVYCRSSKAEKIKIKELCSLNVKRFFDWNLNWAKQDHQNPYLITALQEIKTTWHPIDQAAGGGSKY